MNIRVDSKEYELETGVSNHVVGAEIINKGLEYARWVLSSEPLCRQLGGLAFDGVYAYEEQTINAFSVKQGGTYVIGLSYGFFIKTEKWLMLWQNAPRINDIFRFDDGQTKQIFFRNAYIFIVMFVTVHEAYHILNGHCDLPENENCFMDERIRDSRPEKMLFHQVLEYDADFCASRFCMAVILNLSDDYEVRTQMIRSLGFGLYNMFLLFNDSGEDDAFEFLMQSDWSLEDHPHPGIRQVYCSAAFVDAAMSYIDIEQIYGVFSTMEGECLAYERLLLEHKDLKDCLYAMAYTQKGAQHIMFLVNEWKQVRTRLLNYSHIELRDYDKVDSFPVWVTDKGGFWHEEQD